MVAAITRKASDRQVPPHHPPEGGFSSSVTQFSHTTTTAKDSSFPTSPLTFPSSARCWWLTPVILPTQEAEIRRIVVRSQPRQIVHKTLSRKKPLQKRAGRVAQGVGLEFKPQYCKIKKKKSSSNAKEKFSFSASKDKDSIFPISS
jgi:hypothetical protein